MSWRSIEVADSDGEIRRRLLTPERQVNLAELGEIWCHHTISFRLRGYAALLSEPAFLGRVRGAFGVALMAGASQAAIDGRPCTFEPPCAFEALFRKQGRMTPGLDLASPWILTSDVRRSDLVVSLRLFGFAVEWAPAAAEAMTRSLRELVEWPASHEKARRAPDIAARRAVTIVGSPAASPAEVLELEFLSPLVVSARDPRTCPEILLPGLGSRLSALARWHDVALEERVDWKRLKGEAASLEYSFSETSELKWQRKSHRQGKTIPMGGLLGRLTIAGALSDDVRCMLALGETCGAGADTALGCGRYRLIDRGRGRGPAAHAREMD